MAIRTIRISTDEVLRKICKPVKEITPNILTLLDDMAETMYEANGVGLAAPQVGVLRRIVILEIDDKKYEMINPVIIDKRGKQEEIEACLSVPNKYGSVVRMVKMGTFSTELCGGTHCSNTGEIGLFKIISESSVAAGVRRIEAVKGAGLLDLLNEKDALIADVARELKCQNPADIGTKAAALSAELASARREIDSLNAKLASTKLDSILAATKQVGSVKLAAVRFDGMAIEVARSLADEIKANHPDTVAVIAVNGEKLNFIAVCGADAAKAGAHAGKLVSAVAAVTGGKGGGRPDNAMAGGADASKIDAALALAQATLAGMLK